MIFLGEMLGARHLPSKLDITSHIKVFHAPSRDDARTIMLQFASEVMPEYTYREPLLTEVTRKNLDELLMQEGLKLVPIE